MRKGYKETMPKKAHDTHHLPVWGVPDSAEADIPRVDPRLEPLYQGFRQRLLTDPAFEGQVLELILDRIMAELYVPLNRTPRKGLVLELKRKATQSEKQEN